MDIKGLKRLERLVGEEKTIKERQFDSALYVIKNNKSLWEKIVVKGSINGDSVYRSLLKDSKEKITGAEYYPRRGFKIGGTAGLTRGSWHPNIPHCGSDHTSSERFYYIPSQDKFISVSVHSVYGHTAGYLGFPYSSISFNGAKDVSRKDVFKNFNAKAILNYISPPKEKPKKLPSFKL